MDEFESIAPFTLITDRHKWATCLKALQAEPRLAIDLEANSMFAYREQVCLIQVSIPTADFIIDPLADIDLSSLGDILADPSVEKIFHAAEYDLILLQRDYGWGVQNLFDTMWAARILGYSQIGLASLLEHFYGLKLSKRFQKANWCHRPLSEAELAYAQKDTHYLIDLRDRLAAELAQNNCLEEAQEIFSEQARVRLPKNGFDPDGFWYMNGTFDLQPVQQAALRSLYLFRDQEAKRRDIPHFKVFGDRTLLELAEKMPANQTELETIHGLTAGLRRRYGRHILNLIDQARHAPAPRPPKRAPRPPDDVLIRYDRLHRWRKQRAQNRGVESDVILSRDALWAIANNNPQTLGDLAGLNVMGPWRYETYSREILQITNDRQGFNA